MLMRLWLTPLDNALPAVDGYLRARGDKPFAQSETRVAAQLLEQVIKTCEALVSFALLVGGKPSRQ